MKKNDGSIKSLEEFKVALAPFQQKITDIESKLTERQNALAKYRRDLTKAGMDLADKIKITSETGTKIGDGVIEAKAKCDGLELICSDLEKNVIPKIQTETADAKKELAIEVQNLLKNYKQSFKERMDVAIEGGLHIGVDWIDFCEGLLVSLNIKGSIPYWEVEALVRIVPNMGKDLSQGYKMCLGLDK